LFSFPAETSSMQFANAMFDSLQQFDDSGFAASLSAMPLPVTDASVMDESSLATLQSLFQRVVVAASRGQCAASHADAMFSAARNSKEPMQLRPLWARLSLRLRKKLLLLRMAACIAPLLQRRANASASPSRQSLKSRQAHRGLAGKQAKTAQSIASSLQQDLSASLQQQALLRSRIAGQLQLLVSETSRPGQVQQLQGHPSAARLARAHAAEVLLRHQRRLDLLVVRTALGKWEQNTRRAVAEVVGGGFLRQLAAKRLLRTLQFGLVRTLKRALRRWERLVDRQRREESEAAAGQIQRVQRGRAVRLLVARAALCKAAVAVQRVVRGHLVRLQLQGEEEGGLDMPSTHSSRSTRSLRRNSNHSLRSLRRMSLQQHSPQLPHRRRSSVGQARPLDSSGSPGRPLVRAAVQIQRVLRGHLGRLRARGRALQRQERADRRRRRAADRAQRRAAAAGLLQRVVRGLLGRREVRGLRRLRLREVRGRAAVCIQRVLRGRWGRARASARSRLRAAARIQLWVRGLRARKELARRRTLRAIREAAAARIQRSVRGLRARRRVALLRIALTRIGPRAKGCAVRMRWGPLLRAHCERRLAAALVLQRFLPALSEGRAARRRVKGLRRARAAVCIQRCVRGRQTRRRLWGSGGSQNMEEGSARAFEEATQTFSKHPGPALDPPEPSGRYCDLRARYLLTLETRFHSQILVLQCFARTVLARHRLHQRRRERCASILQRLVRRFLCAVRARKELARRRSLCERRTRAALTLQRMGRGLLVRTGWRRRFRAAVMTWFLRKLGSALRTRLALQRLRAARQKQQQLLRAAVTIQALARRTRARRFLARHRKRLTRERNARIKQRRLRAAVRLQSFFRGVLARRSVRKRRLQRQEEQAEQAAWRELEASVDGLHDVFLLELMAIRLETGARGMLSRKALAKRVAAAKKERQLEKERQLHRAVSRIQALVRGVLARKRHRKNLPQLKKAKQARLFCVECELQPGVRRCRQCRDNYCKDCFEALHCKGTRRTHTFDNVRLPPGLTAASSQQPTGPEPLQQSQQSGAAKRKNAGKGKNNKDWEEFFDSSAKAKYWFNKVTGEASWISPY